MKKKLYIHYNEYLTKEQVKKLFKAAERAYELNCPLNRFITLVCDDYVDKKRPQAFMVKLMEHSRKWLKQRGFSVAYLYVIENGDIKGIHFHLLIHIPRNYQVAYKKALRRWLPFTMDRERVRFKTIDYPTYGRPSSFDSVYGVLRYMSKGINPNTPYDGIRSSYQGKIMGRRWGISSLLKN